MSEKQKALLDAIDELVQIKTFGLDALKAIESLREKAEKQASELEEKEHKLRDYATSSSHQQQEISQLKNKIGAMEADEAALVAREAKMVEIEKSLAVAQAETRIFDKLTERMLRNRSMRETIMESGQTPVPGSAGSYPQSMPTSSTRTTEREET